MGAVSVVALPDYEVRSVERLSEGM